VGPVSPPSSVFSLVPHPTSANSTQHHKHRTGPIEPTLSSIYDLRNDAEGVCRAGPIVVLAAACPTRVTPAGPLALAVPLVSAAAHSALGSAVVIACSVPWLKARRRVKMLLRSLPRSRLRRWRGRAGRLAWLAVVLMACDVPHTRPGVAVAPLAARCPARVAEADAIAIVVDLSGAAASRALSAGQLEQVDSVHLPTRSSDKARPSGR
jgi:hypothetical protein